MEFKLPRTSFNSVRTVIQAGYMANKRTITSAEWGKVIPGKNLYENVRRSLGFLKELGLIEISAKKNSYELTDTFMKLGEAIRAKDERLEITLWRALVYGSPFLKEIIKHIEFSQDVKGFIKKRELKEFIISLAGYQDKTNINFFDIYAAAIVTLLEQIKVIEIVNKLDIKLSSKSIVDEVEMKKYPFYNSVFGVPNKKYSYDLFVLMPFLSELKPVFDDHIKPIANALNLTVARADDFFSQNAIIEEIWSAIALAQILIADCTNKNPNVFYEIGIAHAIGKPVILITQNYEDVPFDLRHRRFIQYTYTPPGMKTFETALSKTILETLKDLNHNIQPD